MRRPGVFFLIAAVLLLGPRPAAAEVDLSPYGFPIGVDELEELLAFQRSVRLEPEARVMVDWSARFRDLRIGTIERSQNRYAYAVDPLRHRQIVAIRGTANLVNAFYDLDTWKIKSGALGIHLHRGFENAARLVLRDVFPYLRCDMPILVCGHSLGAAEALIVGMMLRRLGYPVERVVASGPPKVTDEAGWEAFADLPVIRITAAFDPVPFLPMFELYPKAPFVQGGPLLMLLDGPFITVTPSFYYDATSPAFAEVKKALKQFTVTDHRVWTYRNRIAEKREGVSYVPFWTWHRYAKPRAGNPSR